MGTPKISVITSAYNAEKTIEETIKSVINQTYKDFEYIIVNHGCTDGTVEIIKKYQNIDNRIRIINMPKNTGYIGIALNKGLDESLGEYICFIDADDRYKIDFLERMLGYVSERDYDIAISNFESIHIKRKMNRFFSKIQQYVEYKIYSYICYEKYIIEFLSQKGNSFYLDAWWNKIYKKAFLLKNSIKFLENIHYVSDAFFNMDLLKNSPLINATNYVGVEYYISADSTSRNYKLKKIEEMTRYVEYKYEIFVSISSNYKKDRYYKSYVENQLGCIANHIYNNNDTKIKIKDMQKCIDEMLSNVGFKDIVNNAKNRQEHTFNLIISNNLSMNIEDIDLSERDINVILDDIFSENNYMSVGTSNLISKILF